MKKTFIIFSLVLLSAALSAQDAKQTFTRKIVIEQFTGVDCGWCPQGANRISDAIDGMSNIIWIKYHAGFREDFLTNPIATAMTVFFGGGTYAPAFMLDRTHFDASEPGPVMGIGAASSIRSCLAQAKQVPTSCKVYTPEVAFEPASRTLRVTASGRFGDESYGDSTRLVVYLIEDSIIGLQHDYTSTTHYDYAHMGTVRFALTDMWGDHLAVDAANNRSFSQSFTFALPDSCVYKNCRIVVLVYNYDPGDINNCPVLNAAESDYLDQHLAIGETAQGCQFRLFPNPASQQVMIDFGSDQPLAGSNGSVSLIDALGRTLLSQPLADAPVQSLSLDGIPAGIYMLRVRTSEAVSTRQLIVR